MQRVAASSWSHWKMCGLKLVFLWTGQLKTEPHTSPGCCSQALASSSLSSACGRTPRLCWYRGTGKLLVDEGTKCAKHVKNMGSKLSFNQSLGFQELKIAFAVLLKVTYPVRKSPTAECRRPTRHSGWWTPCQRWTLETSTWEGGGPVGQSDHRVTKELHNRMYNFSDFNVIKFDV